MPIKKHVPAFFRILSLSVLLAAQVAAFVFVFHFCRHYFAYFYAACEIISVLVVLHIVRQDVNPAYKIPWIILCLVFPIWGGTFYLLFGRIHFTRREKRRSQEIQQSYLTATQNRPDLLQQISPALRPQAQYLYARADAPVYTNTQVTFFPLGENMWEEMLTQLRQAKRFIFLEYFIVAPGKMWDAVLEILTEKAQAGLDVRVLYDDIGCLGRVPSHYARTLEALGIACTIFNPFTNPLPSRLNNRDHRKLCIIDGNVGFTGGINLADEYINYHSPLGHWKDTAVMLSGEGVWSMTAMFLSMWDFERQVREDFSLFLPTKRQSAVGFVQPFSDSPVDHEHVGEIVYQNIVCRAQHYVYLATPYLIIDNETIAALTHAAKSGVDVRIITPGIPDKKVVYLLTRSYYDVLLQAGVKIYEYTPGFLHAKQAVSDDRCAMVGTINMDYRSFCHHYECGVWMCDTPAVAEIKADYLRTLEQCRCITLEDCRRHWWARIPLVLPILRLFSPLF